MIDLLKLSELMQQAGFKNVSLSTEFNGVQFSIVGEGKIGLQKLPVLIKVVERLGREEAQSIAKDFAALSGKLVSMWMGKFFLFCVVARSIDPEAVLWLYKTAGDEQEKAKGLTKEGGGNLIVADLETKTILPKSPRWNTIRFENKIRDVLMQIL